VSHDLVAVEQFCDDVKLIHQGQMVAEGNPSEVILSYMKQYMARIGQLNVEEHGTREVEMVDVRLRDGAGVEGASFTTGSELVVEIRYRAQKRIERPVFGFSIKTGTGFFIFGTNSQILRQPIPDLEPGDGVIRLRVNPLALMEGKYFLSLAIHSWDHAVQYHRREDWYPFAVKNASSALGVFQLNCAWQPGASGEIRDRR
jgi:hypothetical protein